MGRQREGQSHLTTIQCNIKQRYSFIAVLCAMHSAVASEPTYDTDVILHAIAYTAYASTYIYMRCVCMHSAQ